MTDSSAPTPSSPLRAVAAVLGRHWAVFVALWMFLLTGLAIFDDYGAASDEHAHRLHGAATVDYILGGGDGLLGYQDRHHGVAFELPLQFIERALRLEDSREVYLTRHLLIHLFFLTGGLFIYLLTARLFRSKLIALTAMLFFLLHPRLYAHSFMNTKDIPFLSMFAVALFLTHQTFRKDTLWAFALLGAGVGTLMNIRVMGAALVPAILGLRGLDLLTASGPAGRKSAFLSSGVFTLAAGLTLYAAMPYLWGDPLGRFIESLGGAARHPLDAPELFRGSLISSQDVPLGYLPTWFSITTHPVALLLGALGAGALLSAAAAQRFRLFDDTRLRFGLFALGCFIAPVAAAVILGSTLFNGWRHLYFLWAPFSLLAAFGLRWIASRFKQPLLRALVYGMAGAGVASMIISIALLHPHQQVYFNFSEDRVTPDVLSGRYVVDYWNLATFYAHKHLLSEESSVAAVQYRPDGSPRFRTLQRSDRERIRIVHPSLAEFSVRTSRPAPGDDALYVEEAYNNVLVALVRERPQENPFLSVYESALFGEPILRSGFDLYLNDRDLIYVKEPCGMDDLKGAFFLRFYPTDPEDLPNEWQWGGYEEQDFRFLERGALFDGRCVGQIPLPDYPVLNVHSYQYYAYANKLYWEALFPLDAVEHYAAYESAASRIPDVRAAFDLHLDEEARTLTYVKEPCALSDIERRFFAHIRPASVGDLLEDRRLLGFDNLDFKFLTRGVVFDGKCAAILPLPEYEIADVRTGQFVSGEGEVWEATVPFGN